MADFHSFDSRTFQSTLPARGATDAKADIDKLLKISIHAPRTGSDVTVYNKWFCRFRFQSTLPARGATTMKRRTIPFPRFQSTLPARGATVSGAMEDADGEISIHAPRTGSDRNMAVRAYPEKIFQSTLPARGATTSPISSGKSTTYFNPRSPHGERRENASDLEVAQEFQSTLPARGATRARACSACRAENFNPRSPHGERRESSRKQVASIRISIHAPRTGSDKVSFAQPNKREIISIHAPRTGSDGVVRAAQQARNISIHAPRTGSDLCRFPPTAPHSNFNPRSPHGERLCRGGFHLPLLHISIHAPRTGSDPRGGDERGGGMAFQSTLPARGATRRFPA